MWQSVLRAHKGQERLVVAFWIWGGAIFFGLSLFHNVLLDAASQAGLKPVGFLLGLLVIVLMDAYSVWVIMVIWRCAYNVGRRLWGHAARVAAAITVLSIPAAIYEQFLWLVELT